MSDSVLAFLLAVLGGAIRMGTPFLFVSLAECITEKSGRVNLGLEGVLVFSAMAGFGGAYLTGNAWLGVALGAVGGALIALLHGALCSLKNVNDVATGIAIMLFGLGAAFYFGKPLIQPQAPQIPSLPLGAWSSSPAVISALSINALFPLGVALTVFVHWLLANSRWGLLLRMAGESADAARALGYSVTRIRMVATSVGGAIAGLGGASLSLYYPGSWNEQLSSGQGLIAVALVVFARWRPVACLWAALLFGGASAVGPALQAIGISAGYHLFNAMPYVLTLGILIATCSPQQRITGAPTELFGSRQ
jgi:general nucleoside transport system permease protein